MRISRRLYVSGHGAGLAYCITTSMEEAAKIIGPKARTPNSDDIRHFWVKTGIARMSVAERTAKFGPISRQVINNWRRKGGKDLKGPKQEVIAFKIARIKKIITELDSTMSVVEVAKLAKASPALVRRTAAELNIRLSRRRKVPPDHVLIELARGRTWREFADATNVCLGTLRNHIYRNPKLTAAIRKVRKKLTPGRGAQYKLDKKKILSLGKKGISAYAIATMLKAEYMTIRHRLKQLGKEFPDELPPPYGNRCTSGNAVDGSDGRSGDQS